MELKGKALSTASVLSEKSKLTKCVSGPKKLVRFTFRFSPSGFRFAAASWTRVVDAWCIDFEPELNLIGIATKDKKLNFWREVKKGEICSVQVTPLFRRALSGSIFTALSPGKYLILSQA